MHRLITSLIASLICVICFSQVNDSITLGQAISLHDKAIKMHESGKSSDALVALQDALALLDSLHMKKTSTYAIYKHDIGMLFLLGNKTIAGFEKNMQEAIKLKQMYSDESDCNYSKMCYADGLNYYASSQPFPKNLQYYEKAILIYESIPYYESMERYHLSLNDLSVLYKDVNISKSIDLSHKLLKAQK